MRRKQHRGHLAKARKKHPRCPEYRGKPEIDGRFFWLSAWVGTDVYGQERLNLSATERGPDGKPVEAE